MSNSSNQKVKRNTASPSSSSGNGPTSVRQGPLRATQQFALVNGSPSRKHAAAQGHTAVIPSPTSKVSKSTKTTRSHSETAFVCDRRSPTASPVYKVEKPKALRVTRSVDNINLYLSGQWPKDGNKKLRENQTSNLSGHTSPCYYSDGVFKQDTHTQTPEEWEGADGRRALSHTKLALYKRSKSVGSGEGWSLKSSRDIKAKLQRKENSVKGSQSLQRFSPVSAIPTSLSTHSTQPIKIPVPIHENGMLRGTPGKARASVEGLNPEIEKLIISATNAQEDSTLPLTTSAFFDHPDGHRAPVPEALNTRNVDTQTPSQTEFYVGGDKPLELSVYDYGGRSSSRTSTETDEGSRPQSVSPLVLGPLDIEDHIDNGEPSRPAITAAISPRPNNSSQFIRLPPDGAEKLKSVVEVATAPQLKDCLAPVLMSRVNLQPSEGSAFSSLGKPAPAIIPSRSPIRCVEESH